MDVRVQQRDNTDCGVACIASIARYYGINPPVARIRQAAATDKRGTNILGMTLAAQAFGFEAKGIEGLFAAIYTIPLPAVAHLHIQKKSYHYVVIYRVDDRVVQIMDPADGRMHSRTHEEFKEDWTGVLVLMVPSDKQVVFNTAMGPVAKLWHLVKPHQSMLLQALFGAVVYTLLGLSTAIFVQKIIDDVLPVANFGLLNLMGLVMIALLLLRSLINAFKNILILKMGRLIDRRLILGYYQHLLKLPQEFFDSMQVGEITSRINDAVKIRLFINEVSINMVVNLFALCFALILMFTYYWKLALVILLIVPLYALIYLITNRLNRKWQRKLMEHGAGLESQLVESINVIGTIKRLGLEEHANTKTESKFNELLRTIYRTGTNSLFSALSTESVSGIFVIILLWLGAGLVIQRQISPGELLSFYTLIGYFMGPAASLIGLNKVVQDAMIAADRLFEIMDLQTEKLDALNKIELTAADIGNIRFANVGFRYGTRAKVFDGLNLVIRDHTITAIVGESGSGKSTVASLLQQIYKISEGKVYIGRLSIGQYSTSSLRACIGVVPQQVDLFSGSILSNIAIGVEEVNMLKVHEICDRLGLTAFIQSLPEGFHTPIGENGTTLSGGQKQVLAIARALYRDPEILILDEATSSLDSLSETYVQRAIDHFVKQQKTVIIIAHRLSTVRRASKIIVLKDGKVAEQGSHKHLVKLGGEYCRLWQQYSNPDISKS